MIHLVAVGPTRWSGSHVERALRGRIVRRIVQAEFGQSLSRTQTLAAVRLATDWHGQGPVDLPGCRARRDGGWIVFTGPTGASA